MKRRGGLLLILLLSSATAARGQVADKAGKAPPAAQFLMRGGTDQFLKRFDKNADGLLSRDEAPPFLAKLFDKVDTNQDGKLDRKEIDQLRRKLLVRFGSDEAASAKNAGRGQAKRNAAAAPPLDFDALDRNADGRLTPDELKNTPLASRFHDIDTNHDGQIDRAEFEAFLNREARPESK